MKYFCEDLPELHLCSAGSLLGIHLGPVSFPVGKVSFLTLRPLSFMEFLDACGEQRLIEVLSEFDEIGELPGIAHSRLWELLKAYFVVGGMPEAVKTYISLKDTTRNFYSDVRLKQEEIIESYYADIAKHAGKVNSMHITRVLRSVPAQLQRVIDGSVAKYRIKGVVPGISHYNRLAGAIDWLEAAGLVIKIPIINYGKAPLMAYSRETYFKMMLFDVGIMGCMVGLSPRVLLDYNYGTYKGFFAENFVAQEFLASSKAGLFSWSEKTAEIEFLREVAGEVVPVEVKSGTITKAKSLQVFTSKYQPPFSIILSGKPANLKGAHTRYYPLYMANKVARLDLSNETTRYSVVCLD
ncbi:MAG: DUF4143 domain-containing protein [Deltaproteobacteria bacterium]|nr:DUF4143 domain-containing protein [Deltaproteobacteria bacterium]